MKKMLTTLVPIVVFASFVFFMNWVYPFSSDDCYYGSMWTGTEWTKIGSIWNAFLIDIHDCHRPFVHFFARVFIGCFDKSVFNVVNTLMFVSVLFLAFRLACRTWVVDFGRAAVAVALAFFTLAKGESYLWACGSTNYVWTGSFTLIFCLLREGLEANRVSWLGVFCWLIPVCLFGSANEAFSPPICFALAVTSLINIRKLNFKKILVYAAYGVGAIVLCVIEKARRSSGVPEFSVMNLAHAGIKVFWTVKCVWVVGILFLISRAKMDFLRANGFELVAIGSSMVIATLIGFQGERVLWVANLLAIVVVLREWHPKCWIGTVGLTAVEVVFCFCIPLGLQIRANSAVMERTYLESSDGVCQYDWVPMGMLKRFFFQIGSGWQPHGYHPHSFARFHGRSAIVPIGLPSKLYNGIYKTRDFCSPLHRLQGLNVEAYSSPELNVLVVPIIEGGDLDREFDCVEVEYEQQNSWPQRIGLMWSRFCAMPVPFPVYPVRFKTAHGDFYLVAKNSGADALVRKVAFKKTGCGSPDAGAWWCGDSWRETARTWKIGRK